MAVGVGKLDNGKLDVNVQMEFVILEGWDNRDNRMAPIAKTPEGKTVLFYRESHKLLRPGETWLCRLDTVRDTHINAVPLERRSTSAISEASRVADLRLPDTITQLLITKLEAELKEQEESVGENNEDIAHLKKQIELTEQELRAYKENYSNLVALHADRIQKIIDYRAGIDKLKRLASNDVGVESAEDYWEKRTREKVN